MSSVVEKQLLKVRGKEKHRYEEIINDYRRIFGREFVGGLPATVTRSSVFDLLSSGELFVTPKADGIRLLCYMNYDIDGMAKGRFPYFIDREMEVYRYGNRDFSKETVTFPNCVLDGEMVQIVGSNNRVTQYVYFIFDVLRLDSGIVKNGVRVTEDLTKLSLRERLNKLTSNEEIMSAISKTQKTKYRECIFVIKPYYSSSQLAFQKDKYAFVENSFKKFCNKVIENMQNKNIGLDGLIIADSTAPYVPGCTSKQYKWKPANQQTVDVMVAPDGSTLQTVTGKDRKPVEYKYGGKDGMTLKLDEPDPTPGLQKEKKPRSPLKPGTIIEVLLTNVWEEYNEIDAVYVKRRMDKTKPNAPRTINDVVESVINPVDLNLILDKLTSQQLTEILLKKYFSKLQLLHIYKMKELSNDTSLKNVVKPTVGSKLLIEFPNVILPDSCIENKGFSRRYLSVTESPKGVDVSTGGSPLINIIQGARWQTIGKQHRLSTKSIYGTDVVITNLKLVPSREYGSYRKIKRTIFKATPYTNIIRDVVGKDRAIYIEILPGESANVVLNLIKTFLLTMLRSQ